MKTICPVCGTEFEKVNGTSTYCPNKNCRKVAKRARQKIVDDLIKPFRKGVYGNFKLFNELLPARGKTAILLDQAIARGFDEHSFYISAKDSNNLMWYYCGPYAFAIGMRTGSKELFIYKS